MAIDFSSLIEKCRSNLGEAGAGGRQFTGCDLARLQVTRPGWCRDSDPLSELFRGYRRLLTTGAVVWGALIQANELLFADGPYDHPAEFVYPADLRSPARPAELVEVAGSLYELKGEAQDGSDLQKISDHLANELTRTFGAPVPEALSPELRCETTTVYVVRRHLPCRWLCGQAMPLVVAPAPPRLAAVLPARYWPRELVEWWRSAG